MEPSAGWERTKRIVDLVAGLSVIATMVFIALQWNEMHTGATDTHDLAVAAKSQADAAKNQADNTKIIADAAKSQADNTRNLALAASDQVAKLAAGVKETHALVKASEDTISEMRSNFTKDQRPYMWPKLENLAIEKGKRLAWNIRFINYGKSPAIQADACVALTYGRDAMENAAKQNLSEVCAKQDPLTRSESIVPPGDVIFTTAMSAENLGDDASVAFFRDTDFRVVIRAMITYQDGFGNRYTSTSCSAHLATGAAYTCPKGNEVK